METYMSGEILIVSSCTATKVQALDGRPRWAESLYAGQQHVRLMRGIDRYRDAGKPAGELSFRILSAFHGLVGPRKRVSSYDHSFSGLPAAAIRRQGREKNVPNDIRKILRKRFHLGIFMLGDPYLRACDLDGEVKFGGPTIVFCSPKVARWLPDVDGLRLVQLTNREARRFSCGLIALKGELGGRLLIALSQTPKDLDRLRDPGVDLLDWLEALPSTSTPPRPLLATG
jgi:hypothetical protein